MTTSESSGTTHIVLGLVGHVANGKTTIVKALTGVETRRDSSETSTGKTTKLGYACCTFWQCPGCLKHYSTGKDTTFKLCDKCGIEMNITRHISFVDCPGHHSYISTMIRGGTVMDGAIIVTDVRSEHLQPQTIEHLAILEMMGVKNTLVVQNKVDLAEKGVCAKNFVMLQEELKQTVAERAPVIPLSAQTGKNIDRLIEYIYKMTTVDRLPRDKYPVMSVIRSFDVNRPGIPEDQKKGGVLGVVTRGDKSFKVGDTICIRPSKGLTAKILSIQTEKESNDQTERGCLHGIGTDLPPEITQADRLVGCLAGFAEDLPEESTTLTCQISRLKDAPEHVKVNGKYYLIIGIKKVLVIAVSYDKGLKQWTFQSQEPVCFMVNNCFVYNLDMTLLGTGIFSKEEEKKDVPDIPFDYEEELKLFPTDELPQYDREKIPVLTIVRENRNSLWLDARKFATYVKKDLEDICAYFQAELLASVRICSDGSVRFYKHKILENKLEKMVSKYLRTVSCGQCKSIYTEKVDKLLRCTRCGALTAKKV